MKNFLFALIVVTAVKFAGAQISASSLVGSWKFQNMKAEYPKNMQGKKLADAQKDMQGDIKKFKEATFTFKKDGDCTIGGHHGTWVMSPDGQTVTYINEKSTKEVATIVQLTEHQLIFSRIDDTIKQIFTLTR